MSIPKVCRATPIENHGTPGYKLHLKEDYPVREIKDNEILIDLKATGVCQSDYHAAVGDWGFPQLPGVECMGHEGAGIVVAVGKNVKGWKVGDRAGAQVVYETCGDCDMCNDGSESLCPQLALTAFHRNGTFCQYVPFNAEYAMHLPDNVPWEQLAPFMCSGGTAYTAVKEANLKPGQWVAVPGGAGGVGHMVIQFAKAMGYRPIAIDVGADKKDGTLRDGAEAFIDVTATPDLPQAVRDATDGKGVHAVIVTAGSAKAYEGATKLLRPRGTLVCVGLPPAGSVVAGAEPSAMCFGGLTVKGILVATRDDLKDALKLLEAGKVKEHVTKLPFSQLPQAVADVGASKIKGRAVIMFNDADV